MLYIRRSKPDAEVSQVELRVKVCFNEKTIKAIEASADG